MAGKRIFITGGTGYLGQRLIPELLERGAEVRALVREGSEGKLPRGCEAVVGNALDKASFAAKVQPSETFVQLVGVPRPSPAKAKQFREIDLVSVRASVAAAVEAGIKHFVYLSVAQPAPIMKAYQEVRAEGERLLLESGLKTTILRPWYVLGPGHRWPYLLLPVYKIMEAIPSTRTSAERLGLVNIRQMTNALVNAVLTESDGTRIFDVPKIRQSLS
ncbi:MAG: NAD(P)H-binding protein [Acidobacteria bacterium]|nr:NAD(P)H-binding protein [Acidobacteriota bacterium]